MSEESLELKRGGDNPFRGLALPDPDANRIKADLAAAIIGILDRRGLSVRAAGKAVSVPHSAIVNIRTAKGIIAATTPLPYCGDAYRAIYAVAIGEDIRVLDAFMKKSKRGIKTPKQDIERIRARLRRLREVLRWARKAWS